MESQYCIFTIAVLVVVTIVVISLVILIRDVTRFLYKKISGRTSTRPLPPRPKEEEDYR
ncbi:MAG: hypothetical protein M5R36_20350 [Deltaproteobacteria bacterium]|nr:hypothetical protein [Deltaproteobacteria bacterium]